MTKAEKFDLNQTGALIRLVLQTLVRLSHKVLISTELLLMEKMMEKTPWKIEWSDALSMYHPEIDNEHKDFIAHVNDLNHAIIARQDKPDVERIMEQILKNALSHFAHEEALFLQKGYPAAKEHATIHKELTRKLEQVSKKFSTAEFSREWIDAGLTIKSLLINHILNEDVKYIDYLRSVK